MDKEQLRLAFEAGKKYWSAVQTDEPLLMKPIDFEEWLDTIDLPKASAPTIPSDEEIMEIAFNYGYGMDINSPDTAVKSHIDYVAGLTKMRDLLQSKQEVKPDSEPTED